MAGASGDEVNIAYVGFTRAIRELRLLVSSSRFGFLPTSDLRHQTSGFILHLASCIVRDKKYLVALDGKEGQVMGEGVGIKEGVSRSDDQLNWATTEIRLRNQSRRFLR